MEKYFNRTAAIAVLLVLASHTYDDTAYINTYEEFLKSIGK